MRRLPAAVLGAVLALALPACSDDAGGGPTGEPVQTNQVDLPKSYRFEPPAVLVDAGTEVTWTNNDDFPHNVTLLDGSDLTIDLPVGGRGSHTFEEPGTVDYECSLHPQQMQGTVTVA
jgi:plastocyanin